MSLNISTTEIVEQLFLDLPIQQVLHDRAFVEPWKSMYVDAIRDGRFGDAVWARYHIYGDVEVMPGIDDPAYNMTALEAIKEDALGYRANEPEEYFKALAFYSTTSAADGHADVIEIITNLSEEEIAEFRAKEKDDDDDDDDDEEGRAWGWALLAWLKK
ncbi:hypothetical protein BJX63DRAFT_434908 [Aspergillus granulosus]|uniref:Uncharacterized protein n=1 Tax=Aspergillus granulosus TaxID=176169 RepID=A0ABR4H2W5_9EURO